MEEKLIWEGSPSPMKSFGAFAFSFILEVIIIGGAIYSGQMLFLAFLAIPAFFTIWKLIEVKSYKYEITNQRIRYTTGILTKQTEDMELYRVKDYKQVQPLLLRMFGLTNIYITTSDKSSPDFVIMAVPHGRELIDKLRNAVEDRRDVKRVSEIDFNKENLE